jgi:hypothetical protein
LCAGNQLTKVEGLTVEERFKLAKVKPLSCLESSDNARYLRAFEASYATGSKAKSAKSGTSSLTLASGILGAF